MRPIAERRNVELKLDAAPDPCVAAVDYNQIQQALSNLVMNAIQAMPSGGEVVVTVGQQACGGRTLAVRDNGKGIPSALLERIFEPFFTTQGAGEGTGLGLSITEGIVRDHGGSIEVQSEVGKGSCFTLHLPAGPLGKPSVPVQENA